MGKPIGTLSVTSGVKPQDAAIKAPKRKDSPLLDTAQPKSRKKPKPATAADGSEGVEGNPKAAKKRSKVPARGDAPKTGVAGAKAGAGEDGGAKKEEEPWQPPPLKSLEVIHKFLRVSVHAMCQCV